LGCSAGAGETASEGAEASPVAGASFASLIRDKDHLAGVFVDQGESLVFDVRAEGDHSALRLSTLGGAELYWAGVGPEGVGMRVGRGFQSFLPTAALAGSMGARNASPAGFQVTGNLLAEYEALQSTPFAVLPGLSAALGREGLDGNASPLAMRLHLLALELAQQRQHGEVDSVKPADGATSATPVSPAATSESVAVAASALSPDYSQTVHCKSGVGRRALGDLTGDPCRDGCFGMCGPGCDPWPSVCGDNNVHAICWQHDSAYCPKTLGSVLGVPIPNLAYPVCMAEYAVYSATIGGNGALGNCEVAEPVPFGLWSSRPNFYENYGQAGSTTVADVTFQVAAFDVSDTRFFVDSGDWSVGYLKAECAQNEKLIGISATAVSPEIHANAALCVSTPISFVRTGFGLTTHHLDGADDRADASTGDWDIGYTKAECGVGEAVTGVSQSPDLKLKQIQCSWIESESANNVHACTALPFSSTSDNRLTNDPGDWAVGYSKNQCRSNQYLKGISSNSATGEIHSLLCCDSTPFPH
jgi:hypothetical protein